MNQLQYLFFFLFISSTFGSQGQDAQPTLEDLVQGYQQTADYIRDQFVHIFPNYTYRNEPFEAENKNVNAKSSVTTTYIFENRNAGEHMFNLKVVHSFKDKGFSLSILNAKNQKINKKFESMDWNELAYQMDVFQLFIQNALSNNAFWRKKSMHVNLLSDVLRELKKQMKHLELVPFGNPMEGYDYSAFMYNLKLNDIFIGTLSLSKAVSEQEAEIGGLHLSGNYSLKVGFQIALDNYISSGEIPIPMLSDKADDVSNLVKTAVSAIDQKQFNSFDDIKARLNEYFSALYPEIEITEVPSNDSNYNNGPFQYFTLGFENSAMEMYLGTRWNSGGYNEFDLFVDAPNNQFNSPSVSASFLRSGKKTLFDILNNAGANNIFQSVFMDITGMFSYGFQEIIDAFNQANTYEQAEDQTEEHPNEVPPAIPALEFFDNTKNLTGDKSKGLSNGDVTLSYHVKSGSGPDRKIVVEMKCASKDLSFKKSFKLNEYERNTVWGTMNLFFSEYRGQNRLVL